MPITYRLDESLGVVFTTAHGAATDAELLEYGTGIVNDPALDPSFHHLIDLRDADATSVSSDTIWRLAEIFRDYDRLPVGAKIAIVTASDVTFGMARMYEVYRDEAPIDIRVFRNIEEARRWLGLPEGTAAGQAIRDGA